MLYKRVLLKLSGEAMLSADGKPIDQNFLSYISGEVGDLRRNGIEVAIVIGGGNIFRGLSANSETGLDRVTGDNMGMLGTVINSLALKASFEAHGMPAVVMSALEIDKVAEFFVRDNAVRHLEEGKIVIFGAGTGNPFFTTDTAAALRANEIGADLLIKATKVDGLYDKDPKKFADAKFIKEITFAEAVERKLRVMDLTALTLCEENRLCVKIVNVFQKGNILKAVEGNETGSLVTY
ncbi:UMP kinase [bacterium]|nr:UMP kinase [bacterium]